MNRSKLSCSCCGNSYTGYQSCQHDQTYGTCYDCMNEQNLIDGSMVRKYSEFLSNYYQDDTKYIWDKTVPEKQDMVVYKWILDQRITPEQLKERING